MSLDLTFANPLPWIGACYQKADLYNVLSFSYFLGTKLLNLVGNFADILLSCLSVVTMLHISNVLQFVRTQCKEWSAGSYVHAVSALSLVTDMTSIFWEVKWFLIDFLQYYTNANVRLWWSLKPKFKSIVLCTKIYSTYMLWEE